MSKYSSPPPVSEKDTELREEIAQDIHFRDGSAKERIRILRVAKARNPKLAARELLRVRALAGASR